jgi:hypothetical protein
MLASKSGSAFDAGTAALDVVRAARGRVTRSHAAYLCLLLLLSAATGGPARAPPGIAADSRIHSSASDAEEHPAQRPLQYAVHLATCRRSVLSVVVVQRRASATRLLLGQSPHAGRASCLVPEGWRLPTAPQRE